MEMKWSFFDPYTAVACSRFDSIYRHFGRILCILCVHKLKKFIGLRALIICVYAQPGIFLDFISVRNLKTELCGIYGRHTRESVDDLDTLNYCVSKLSSKNGSKKVMSYFPNLIFMFDGSIELKNVKE